MPFPTHVSLPRSASVDLVREALSRRRMSQKDLASRCGLPKDQLGRILAGKVPFPRNRQVLIALAGALGMDPADFPEYRERLQVLPESSRRLMAQLKAAGISEGAFMQKVTSLSEDQIRLILRGGSPFPRDPRILEDLAQAAGTVPFLFPEYLPIASLKDRMLRAAEQAMGPEDLVTFSHLLAKIEAYLEALDLSAFEEQVVARMSSSSGEDAVGEMRAFLPRWEDLQPEVRQILTALQERGWSPPVLAEQAAMDVDELFAVLKGQVRLSNPTHLEAIMRALAQETADGENPARG